MHHRDCRSYGRHRSNTHTVTHLLLLGLLLNCIHRGKKVNFFWSLSVFLSNLIFQVGVIGYMTWWGVRLDGVALINLIMCIGFSVDFR